MERKNLLYVGADDDDDGDGDGDLGDYVDCDDERTFSPLVQMIEPFSPWERIATTAMSNWWCTWSTSLSSSRLLL